MKSHKPVDMQKHLLYITNLTVNQINIPKIRAVSAIWIKEKNTASISFYFDGDPNEDEIEIASLVCAEIIAHCSNGLLEENYLSWQYPKALPKKFLAYERKE